MSGLTDHQVITITRATILAPRCPWAISDHECGLILEVAERFLQHGRATFLTDAEWVVVEDALDALSAAARRSPNTVAEDAAGVRAGSSQPAA